MMNDVWSQMTASLGPLLVALACGGVLGLNRDLHHKPAGLRTFSLVALAAALTVLVIHGQAPGDSEAVSRVMQGMLTGIGFVGAGVILRRDPDRISGLTTAAAVVVAAAMGMAAGLRQYGLALTGLSLALLVLVVGRRLERAVHAIIDKSTGVPREPPSGD
jgi:putative Mg2+ transporter-C (MgtC) family protein